MIPVKLTMRNFMCYRDNVAPLHFDGLHLACLSGDNGNGKSAIIDAMTWALWGKTRAGSDDDLIHAGQPDMEVELEFRVGEQPYRIIRKRARPRKAGGAGQSALEFQAATEDGFRAITGDTLTKTQQEIIGRLHMDYDTFVNSAYLRQGHADEFTIKRPAERKEVLADILGLSRYDELEERARELARQQENERAQLENAIGDIGEELGNKAACEAELAQAQAELAAIEAEAREKETDLNARRQQKESLEGKKTQLDELAAQTEGNRRLLKNWEQQAEQHRARINEYQAVIGRGAAIEEGYKKYEECKKANEEFYKKSQESGRLEKQRAQLDARITEASHELTRQHALVQQRIDDLENRTKQLPALKERLAQAQVQVSQLAGQEAALHQKEQEVQEAQRLASHLEPEIAQLGREIGEVTEKLDLLASHIAAHTEARCPLCETELTQEGLSLIQHKYTKEKQEKSDLLKSRQAELAQKQAELAPLQKEKAGLEARFNEASTAARSRADVVRNEIARIEEEDRQTAGLREELGGIERRLARRDFAAAEQEALANIEAGLSGLGYDAEKHEEARRRLTELESFGQDKRKLEEAIKLIETEKEALARAGEASTGLQQNLASAARKQETLAAELTGLPALLEELAGAEAAYRELAARRSQSQEAVGSIKARLQRLSELEERRKEKEGQLAQAAREENIYRELARAFGKGGIQAMLIETAFPEVEEEANQLLARMTDNRMHVKFETQREAKSKKGSVVETLDINIADELGTRNYEMFSGGEAFRINFAIRIALSRLLARRAGAPLRTLIIDEGFGTQDAAGLEKLKEAIISIRDDFDKILVITHVEELRDAFPARIDVTKTADGSVITVN